MLKKFDEPTIHLIAPSGLTTGDQRYYCFVVDNDLTWVVVHLSGTALKSLYFMDKSKLNEWLGQMLVQGYRVTAGQELIQISIGGVNVSD